MWYSRLKKWASRRDRKKTGALASQRKSVRWGQSFVFRVFAIVVAFALGLSLVIHAHPASSQQRPRNVELTLVSFSVTQAAYSRIIPGFVAKWKREHNQNVTISQSYGGSGSQTRAVINGLDADVVHLADAGDTNRIQQAGLINPGWQQEVPNGGIVSKSVVALVTRAGNPKGIRSWADLARSGVRVITANPKTSGVGRWNFLALWGSVTKNGGNEATARNFVNQVYRNVPILAKDAREATDIFYKQGQGDVLLNYENEVILARQQGLSLPFTLPAVNISIDNAVAVVDKNVDKHGTRQVADAFVKYLFTPEAQREFAKVGFRPVNATVAGQFSRNFPKINKLFKVSDLGGWGAADRKFFGDGAVFDQLQTAGRR
jgi:sulfate/thiosulfate-binding protein